MKDKLTIRSMAQWVVEHQKTAVLCIVMAFLSTSAVSQTIECGVYSKPAPAGKGPFYTDRFGNVYSQSELLAKAQKEKSMMCTGTGEFNLIIQNATAAQEAVICDVFSYLSGLIIAPPTGGTVNLEISFDPALIGSGAGGIGTPFFVHQCGIGHSMVQEEINVHNPAWPLHGLIKINPQYNWYTELDLTPAIASTQIDLYTVVLHEALHVLGFASQISASGDPIQGFFTVYDLHLYTSQGQPFVLADPMGDCCSGCCMEYEQGVPNMPTPILQGCGDVVYNVSQLPPVNGEYAFTPPLSDNTAANMLSHLDIICGAEKYVMHYEIGTGATNTNGTPNIRREVTDTEADILCTLGYDISTECDPSCMVVVNDDGPFALISEFSTLAVSDIISNDFIAGNDYEIDFNFSCGNAGNLLFNTNGNPPYNLTIQLNGTPDGLYDICYTITSCDDRMCQTGTMQLLVIDPIDPTICCGSDSNLVNYGDFEDFPVGYDTYYPSFIPPYNSPIRVPTPTNGLGNTVDIFLDGDNQYVRFIRCTGCDQENLLMPLCSEVLLEKCSLDVSFDACVDNSANGNQPVTLGVWALSSMPSSMTLPNATVCNGQLLDNSSQVIGICLGDVTLSSCVGEVNFSNYSFSLPAGVYTSAPITHIWLFDYPMYQNGFTDVLIDNVVVTSDCPFPAEDTCDIKIVCNEPNPDTICVDSITTIVFELCAPEITCSNTTLVTPELNLPPGWVLLGNAPLSFELAEGTCQEIEIKVQMPPGTAPSSSGFELKGIAEGFCAEVEWSCSAKLEVISCEPEPPEECELEVVKECIQLSKTCWQTQMTPMLNGQPIANGGECNIVWQFLYVPPPMLGCPYPPTPWQFNNPIMIPGGVFYRVIITCGDDCYYREEGVTSCFEDFGGGGDEKYLLRQPMNGTAEASSVAVFPNPAQNEISIRVRSAESCVENCVFQLFDSYGQLVLTHPLMEDGQWQILDVSAYPSGVYYWKLTQNATEVMDKGKMVIVH